MTHRPLALLFATLAALALPAVVRAQHAGDAAPAPLIKLSADGEWLAIVPAAGAEGGNGSAILGLGAESWRPGLAAVLVAPAASGRLAASASRQVLIEPVAAASSVAPWCAGIGGYLAGSAECLLGDAGGERQPRLERERATVSWANGQFRLSLSGGEAAWRAPYLPREDALPAIAVLPVAGAADAASRWVLVGARSARDLSLGAGWTMPWLGTVDIEATLADIALAEGGGALLDSRLRESSLRVALSRGSFSGGLTGRVVRPELAGRMGWSSLDLGVAWRTPWQGELSFGAENLLSAREDDSAPKPDPRLDSATARTPYVRYTQDF